MTVTRQEWAQGFLAFASWPVSTESVTALVAVASVENSQAVWNPLDTTEPAEGATDYNSVGVKNYPSQEIGYEATFATLMNGLYPDVVAQLQSGASATAIANAWSASPWGTKNVAAMVATVKANPDPYMNAVVAGSEDTPTPAPEPAPEPVPEPVPVPEPAPEPAPAPEPPTVEVPDMENNSIVVVYRTNPGGAVQCHVFAIINGELVHDYQSADGPDFAWTSEKLPLPA